MTIKYKITLEQQDKITFKTQGTSAFKIKPKPDNLDQFFFYKDNGYIPP